VDKCFVWRKVLSENVEKWSRWRNGDPALLIARSALRTA